MTNIVIFSDASSTDNDLSSELLPSLPMKSIGPYRIANEARSIGYTCQVISIIFEFSIDEVDELCRKFITDKTLIVGLSTTFWTKLSTNKKEILKKIIQYTRSIPTIKLILGGTSARAIANQIKADACFEGYADNEFIIYLKSLKNNENMVFNQHSFSGTPIIKFDEENDFDFSKSTVEYTKSDCLISGENITIEIGRGCIFKCDFCAFPHNG